MESEIAKLKIKITELTYDKQNFQEQVRTKDTEMSRLEEGHWLPEIEKKPREYSLSKKTWIKAICKPSG